MGKIYYMMGKSSSGKDTLFKEVKEALPELRTVTLYTTRPIREGEKDGVEYFFVTDEVLDDYGRRGLVVEERGYHTVCGLWRYATVDDGQIDLAASDYLVIGTLESYEKMREYYGAEQLVPIYIEVEDGWLGPLTDWMDSHPECGICAPKLHSCSDTVRGSALHKTL